MSKRLMLPGVLVLSGIVLRFFFTGVGYIAYAMFFAAALIAIQKSVDKAHGMHPHGAWTCLPHSN